MTDRVGAPSDVAKTLAAIRAQAAMMRAHAFELEQLGLTLSGRDLDTVDQADLVSYLVWISQMTSHTALVLASWGVRLVAYVDGTVPTAEKSPTPASSPAKGRLSAVAGQRRWWRRS